MEILQTENLSKVYHGAHEVQAVNEVNSISSSRRAMYSA
jgi:hypothetical protein